MNPARRWFFTRAAVAAAIPVVGIAKAIGVAPPVERPAPIQPGSGMSSKDFNARFDAVYRAINQR